jgi:hypothetical protein
MKLTKSAREAFVNAVMADVPKIGYYEKFANLGRQFALSLLPEDVFNLYKIHPAYFKECRVSIRSWNIYAPSDGNINFTTDQIDELCKFSELNEKQNENRLKLKRELMLVAQSCSTLKQLQDAFPELKKYMASEPLKGEAFPLVATNNVMSSLIKAGMKIKK